MGCELCREPHRQNRRSREAAVVAVPYFGFPNKEREIREAYLGMRGGFATGRYPS
jgi:hypothetical protein